MAKARHSRFDCNPGCAVEAAISLIDGKWKSVILHHLLGETARFNEIRRLVPGLTPRMLTNQLRDLEIDGLVTRTVYAQVPPKVEYSVSELGRSLAPIIEALRIWGTDNMALFEKHKPSAMSQKSESSRQPLGLS